MQSDLGVTCDVGNLSVLCPFSRSCIAALFAKFLAEDKLDGERVRPPSPSLLPHAASSMSERSSRLAFSSACIAIEGSLCTTVHSKRLHHHHREEHSCSPCCDPCSLRESRGTKGSVLTEVYWLREPSQLKSEHPNFTFASTVPISVTRGMHYGIPASLIK